MNSALDAVVTILREKSTFVLSTHVNPDGDGLGSEVALALALREIGKSTEIINHSPTPAVYDFLDPDRRIRVFEQTRDSSLIASADAILVLDTNQPERLRSMQQAVMESPAVRICIDHHLEPARFADHYLLDDDATSTGEIVYRILRSLPGNRLSPAVAEALYTAIMTDTGSFRYPRVDGETHEIVADLLRNGADPVKIYSLVYERWTGGRIHLLGEMLSHITLASEGRIACVAITRRMLEETGTSEEDTDNFTSYLMSIAGVRAGILVLELPRGVKISFRSRGDIPINRLAKEFGGNGHRNAAGARLYDATLPDIKQQVIHAAAKYV